MRREGIKWEKYLQYIYICDRDTISRIYKTKQCKMTDNPIGK